MKEIKENDIIEAIVTGIQNYGAFVKINNEYNGLIHLSEISYDYIKDITKYINTGDKIHAKVIKIDNENKKINLSIKDIDYKNTGEIINQAKEENGFLPLKEHLEHWIDIKIKEIMDKM